MMAPVTDIDPTGDVIFILGAEEHEKRLRVSSDAISRVSSVWRTMLNSSFIEGQKKDGIREVSLPDDDAEAVIVLCNIAHFRPSEVKITFSLFEQLSILCDKYDAAQAMISYSTVGLLGRFRPDIMQKRGKESRLPRLLHMAFAFNNAKAFALFSKFLLFECGSSALAGLQTTAPEFRIFPLGFLGESTFLT